MAACPCFILALEPQSLRVLRESESPFKSSVVLGVQVCGVLQQWQEVIRMLLSKSVSPSFPSLLTEAHIASELHRPSNSEFLHF